MSVLDTFRWAIKTVERGWRSEGKLGDESKKSRKSKSLPGDFTSSTLRYIRMNACRSAGVEDCAAWEAAIEPAALIGGIPIKVVRRKYEEGQSVNSYPCSDLKRCSRPRVPLAQFAEALGEFPEAQSVVRRWMNSRAGMGPDDFKRAVANSYWNGWLGQSQFLNLMEQTKQLEAVNIAARRHWRKISDRKTGFRQSDELKFAVGLTDKLASLAANDELRARRAIERNTALSAEAKEWLLATLSPQKLRSIEQQ